VSLVGAVVLATVLVTAPGARAAPDTCVYDDVTKTVQITFPDGVLDPSRTVSREANGTHIVYKGSACGDATVINTDTIAVTGGAGGQYLTVDQTNGRFRPGASPEGDLAEIEFSIDLGVGTDTLVMIGTPTADRMFFVSSSSVKVNYDEDTDLDLAGVDRFMGYARAGNDDVGAGSVPIFARGQGGDDSMNGAIYEDSLDGGSGNDILNGSYDRDVLIGGSGSDRLRGNEGSDEHYPGLGHDLVIGGSGDDLMVAAAEPDGADRFDGGLGADAITYEGRTGDLRLILDGRANDGEVGEGDLIDRSIESVKGGVGDDRIAVTDVGSVAYGLAGDDTIVGGRASDSLYGNRGNDELLGDLGDDVLTGGDGDDRLDGGLGDDISVSGKLGDGDDLFLGALGTDTVSYAVRTTHVRAEIGTGGNGGAGEHDSTNSDVESIVGGSGPDLLIGSDEPDLLIGGGGNDSLRGGAGPDRLEAGAGNDAIRGGDGFDQIQAEGGDDILHLTDAGADHADCGSGTDDASDRDADESALIDCEIT
jgi:Ca2+-binding RTX toxin-like protein